MTVSRPLAGSGGSGLFPGPVRRDDPHSPRFAPHGKTYGHGCPVFRISLLGLAIDHVQDQARRRAAAQSTSSARTRHSPAARIPAVRHSGTDPGADGRTRSGERFPAACRPGGRRCHWARGRGRRRTRPQRKSPLRGPYLHSFTFATREPLGGISSTELTVGSRVEVDVVGRHGQTVG